MRLAAAAKQGKNAHRAILMVSSSEPAGPLLNSVQKLARLTGVSSSQLPPTAPAPSSEPAPLAPRGSPASKRKFLIGHYITNDLATAAACTGPTAGGLSILGLQPGTSAVLPPQRATQGNCGCCAGRGVMGAEREDAIKKKEAQRHTVHVTDD